MIIQCCQHADCQRPFQINSFQGLATTGTQPGRISCPHCGFQMLGEADTVFLTHALLEEDEANHLNHRPQRYKDLGMQAEN